MRQDGIFGNVVVEKINDLVSFGVEKPHILLASLVSFPFLYFLSSPFFPFLSQLFLHQIAFRMGGISTLAMVCDDALRRYL